MKPSNDYELPDNGLFPEQYSVREIIRDGASSTIFRGYDAIADNDVVIKCFKPSAKGAYLREIGAAFDIQHPHLVSCLNTFHRTDGAACIVYEYLAGGSLATVLETQAVDVHTITACLQAVLSALIYLNSVNRIHCDIKPENILLRPKTDGQVDYVLIDLGAACFLREAQEGQHVTGTPAYIAPERIKNRFFFNSDLYSLGVIAFEMCTGKRPFTGTVDELTQANLSEIPSLSEIEPPALRDFIDHLLVKRPQQRIASADLALTLLNKAINNIEGSSNQASFDSPVPNPEGEVEKWALPADNEELLALHCFHVNDQALIGLVYSHYVDIIDPLNPQYPFKTLLTGYPIQILGNNTLAYATPSRIQMVDLSNSCEWLVKERLDDLKAWHVTDGKLLWSNAYYRFYEDFNANSLVKFGVPNYLFNSEINVLENGSFVSSEGLANNKIVLRDENVNVTQEWLLDDSVIGLSHHNASILAVTLNLNNNNAYTLWRLTVNQSTQKLTLSDNISQILCINGAVFWLANKTELNYCDAALQPQTLNTFANSVFKFAVSHDHRFVVIGYKDDENKVFFTLLKTRAVL